MRGNPENSTTGAIAASGSAMEASCWPPLWLRPLHFRVAGAQWRRNQGAALRRTTGRHGNGYQKGNHKESNYQKGNHDQRSKESTGQEGREQVVFCEEVCLAQEHDESCSEKVHRSEKDISEKDIEQEVNWP